MAQCRPRSTMGRLQRQLGTDQKFWRRGPWAASISFSVFALAPASVATAQQVVVRDICSPLAATQHTWVSAPGAASNSAVAKSEVNESEAANSEADKPHTSAVVGVPGIDRSDNVAATEVNPPEVANVEVGNPDTTNNEVATFGDAAKVLGCVLPSSIGVVYSPKITANIRRQYENSLPSAKGVTKEGVVANVILDATVDVTTPPPIFYYRDGDSVPYATYEAMEKCMRVSLEDGGICQRNDGSIVISLTGGITNRNPFPLSSVTIQCDYRDALGILKSSIKLSQYTLGPGSGQIPYHDAVVDVLPPHSVVNDVSCKVQTAEIWQITDGIQYLSAPLNPSLESSAPVPPDSQSDSTSF